MFSSIYLYMKAVHLIAAFAWMGGLFVLPRLFSYHAEAGIGSAEAETFKALEGQILNASTTPAMLLTVGLGLWLTFGAHGPDWWLMGWLHAKIALVVLLLVLHTFVAKWRKDFAADKIPHSPRFFRTINEAPTLLLVGIVILAIVQPF